jgi:uncharacterized protein YcsI (UPF0317 family)
VPADLALDFLRLCLRNPLAAPILDVLDPGAPATDLAQGGDVRTDVVRWQVWEAGAMASETHDLRPYWREDLVTVLLGTSHILAGPLKAAGIPEWTVDNPRPAIYRTALRARSAGRLGGPQYVTVKFADPIDVPLITRITAKYPAGHGAPLHIGDPGLIGVDGASPGFGHPLDIPPGTTPVFWACSFTVLEALRAARVPWFACHAPGCTFILDIPPERLTA